MSDDPKRVQEFVAHVQGGGLVEADDWMPDAYRKAIVSFIEFHANSEYMGALLERDWIPRAPTLDRKLALAAKVQDEVGHAQLLYRILEDLGRPMQSVIDDLLAGRTKFHWFFHYKARSWADVGVIAWLSDAASALAQADLAKGSYAPYRRALTKICWEEGYHITWGYDVVKSLMSGTAEQRRMMQASLDEWWMRIVAFNGPPTPPADDPNNWQWRIKSMSNAEMRQKFFNTYVKQVLELGLVIPDPLLAQDPATKQWTYTEPDWEELKRFRLGQGPATLDWLSLRRTAREENQWVLETLAAAKAARA